MFAGVLAVLLIGSINYALSLGFALTFLLAGLGLAGMVHTARNLARIAISAGRAQPVFAGGSAQFRLYLDGRGPFDRPSILARHVGSGSQVVVDVPAGGIAEAVLAVPAERRGWMPLGRVMLETRFPLGLFRAWSYIEPEARCLVYPRPERSPLPPFTGHAVAGAIHAPDPGQRRLRRPAQLPERRFAAPHCVEGGGAQRPDAHQAVRRRCRGRAVARRPAASPWLNFGTDLVPPGRLGARRRPRRRALRPAPARRRDRAGTRRCAPRRVPAGACAARAEMTPHPLAPELRQATARDLAWLIASLLLVIAPHALRAPWWLTLLTLCLYGWRMYFALNRAPLPSRWLVLGVAAVAMLAVWLEYRTLFGRQSGILLLMLFSGLKLLETRSHRDAAVAGFLGFFLIVTNFLYTQTIPIAALSCVALFLITATLISFSAPQRAVRDNLRSAGLLLAHAAPAALVLFLLFPRVQGPLWGLPQDAYAGMTGLSETMTPGSLASLAQSDAIAFRAEFLAESPPAALRYWRGPVLWDFDGRTWSIGPNYVVDFVAPRGGRATYRYEVVIEPHNRHWLFALETAATLPERTRDRKST